MSHCCLALATGRLKTNCVSVPHGSQHPLRPAISTRMGCQIWCWRANLRAKRLSCSIKCNHCHWLGDVNLDGSVNLIDVTPFVMLLNSQGYQIEADINQDGSVDLADVTPFVDLLFH